MALETVTYISDLDPANPTSSDPKSQGDNHLRNIKKALKQTLPNLNAPVNATPTELNRLVGVTSDVQTQLDTLGTNKYDKAGGTVTGEVNVQPASGDALVSISRAAGSNRRVRGRTGTVLRWTLDMGDNAAEAGSNAGSDFALSRYNDGGSLLAVALKIARGTGAVTIPGAVNLGGALSVAGGGTFTGEFTFATEVHVPAPTEPTHATTQQWVADAIAAASGGATQLFRDARTSNTPLNVPDVGKWIDITSGTFTQTFTAVSTLGNGWWCYLSNSGTGDIPLDPSGSETIDGLTSFVMYPGELRLVQCDGTTLRTKVINGFRLTATAARDIIDPPGYSLIEGRLWGGGGGGGKSAASDSTGGGGGGACTPISLVPVPGTVRSVVIGAGGIGASTSAAGGIGGVSTFGGAMAGGGGGGGGVSGSNTFGGAGGGALGSGAAGGIAAAQANGGEPRIGNDPSNPGFGGASKIANNGNVGAAAWGGAGGGHGTADGGQSLYGGGGGGGGSGSAVRAGGESVFGGSGGAGADTTSGTDGQPRGGGGGGTRTGPKGGDGGRGELLVWGII